MKEQKDRENSEEFSFINEKIKRKPVDKRNLLKEGAVTIVLAAIFGIVASIVFTLVQPYAKRLLDEPETVEIPQDETSESKSKEEEKQEEEKREEISQKEEAQKKIESKVEKNEFDIADYQRLQRKLYAIGKKANRSIVTVRGLNDVEDWYDTSFESSTQASGLIVAQTDNELLILTEKKAITDVKNIRVSFIDTAVAPAELKKYDGNTGLAILSVRRSSLTEKTQESMTVATLGNSLSCTQGQIVLAIGSPLGSNYSILQGNITSVNNTISTPDATYSVFTTDMIGSKDGGGALLNLNGDVIGLIMQGYSNQEEEGTLTAISISNLKWVIEQLSNGCEIPYLGLKISTVTKKIAEEFDIPQGVYVKSVEEKSPAMVAGLQSGDVILKMDATSVETIQEYEKELHKYKPGDVLTLTVKRQDGRGYSKIKCTATVDVLQ